MTETEHVRIERTFDAPVDLVWPMWTEPEHFANWYGPTGATDSHGRTWTFASAVAATSPWRSRPPTARCGCASSASTARSTEDAPRLHRAIADEDGKPMPARAVGMPDGAPTETSIVVELEDLGDRTKMVMTHIGVPADSPGTGWAMAIDKLNDAR